MSKCKGHSRDKIVDEAHGLFWNFPQQFTPEERDRRLEAFEQAVTQACEEEGQQFFEFEESK